MNFVEHGENTTFVKRRPVWQQDALRLAREVRCIRYARAILPATVEGVKIILPETESTVGLHVAVRSQRLPGQTLYTLLFEQQAYDDALHLGLVALDALHLAKVRPTDFLLPGLVFRFVKGPRIALSETISADLLSGPQRIVFIRLLRQHLSTRPRRAVLVHGDLHASHVIVDLAQNTLGVIDFEAMHVGKPSTDFAQMWVGYHYAGPSLGRSFFEQYSARHPALVTEQFDLDVRAELAMRSHRQLRAAHDVGNDGLAARARGLLDTVLSGATFAEMNEVSPTATLDS
jgi:aminoglycoside phosphotransferase (APT) family kinase protein